MFTKTKNIETTFRYMRMTSLLIVTGSFLLCGITIMRSYQLAAISESKVYVITNGKAIQAFAADRNENIVVEAKDHVSMFHHYFFTLDPDEKSIQLNITKAFYLADISAKRQYENLKESNYYANIISGNISQDIIVDSVTVNVETTPFFFRCYAKQRITRTTSISTRSLITEGLLRIISRTENNSHGLLIEQWNTIENKDIKTIAR